jgi:hypothetical protein
MTVSPTFHAAFSAVRPGTLPISKQLTHISHTPSGWGQNAAPVSIFHRPWSAIVSGMGIIRLSGLGKVYKTVGRNFSFVLGSISYTAPQTHWRGLSVQAELEVKRSGFSGAGSPTPADKGPAMDNWKPSKPKPYAPSPESARRSSTVSYGWWIPARPPVRSLAGPAAAIH